MIVASDIPFMFLKTLEKYCEFTLKIKLFMMGVGFNPELKKKTATMKTRCHNVPCNQIREDENNNLSSMNQ